MSDSVIDQAVYQELADAVGEDFIGEMIAAFLEEGGQFVVNMRDSFEDGDVDRFRRAAHSLKSNAATFGAMKLSVLAKELEEMARESDLSAAAQKLEPVFVAFESAKKALMELHNG